MDGTDGTNGISGVKIIKILFVPDVNTAHWDSYDTNDIPNDRIFTKTQENQEPFFDLDISQKMCWFCD